LAHHLCVTSQLSKAQGGGNGKVLPFSFFLSFFFLADFFLNLRLRISILKELFDQKGKFNAYYYSDDLGLVPLQSDTAWNQMKCLKTLFMAELLLTNTKTP
jgi:hypothetical protein